MAEEGTYTTKVTIEVGDVVTFYDANMDAYNAQVTAVWAPGDDTTPPSINVVYTSPDPMAKDQYGRQLLRESSVVHKTQQTAHGMYWEMP